MKLKFFVRDICKISGYEKEKIEKDFYITEVANISNPSSNSLMFGKNVSDENYNKLKNIKESIIILEKSVVNSNLEEISKNNFILFVEKPRREYAIILTAILTSQPNKKEYRNLENSIVIGKTAIIGSNTEIEPGVFIDNDVEIGKNCIIMSGTRIKENVTIGDNTIIRENSVIGGQGYGIERDEDGFTIRIPHLGGVIIGNNVEVGALTAIAAGTIDATFIDDYVKIDNLVHIAHNCKIGRGSMIIACAEISGSVEIGENVWVAPNACIINKTRIGSNAVIGMGSVIIKDVPMGVTVTGNPGDTIENIKKFNKVKKRLMENLE